MDGSRFGVFLIFIYCICCFKKNVERFNFSSLIMDECIEKVDLFYLVYQCFLSVGLLKNFPLLLSADCLDHLWSFSERRFPLRMISRLFGVFIHCQRVFYIGELSHDHPKGFNKAKREENFFSQHQEIFSI